MTCRELDDRLDGWVDRTLPEAERTEVEGHLAAIDELQHRFDNLDMVFVESGGDNLSATFSPELSDLTIYVIDVSAGDKIPRKGGAAKQDNPGLVMFIRQLWC